MDTSRALLWAVALFTFGLAAAAVTWSAESTCHGTASGELVTSHCEPTYEALGHGFISGGFGVATLMLLRAWRAHRSMKRATV